MQIRTCDVDAMRVTLLEFLHMQGMFEEQEKSQGLIRKPAYVGHCIAVKLPFTCI